MRRPSLLQHTAQLFIASALASTALGQDWTINTSQTISSGTSSYNIVHIGSQLTQTGGELSASHLRVTGFASDTAYTLHGGTATINTLTLTRLEYSTTSTFYGNLSVRGGALTVADLILNDGFGFLNSRVDQTSGTVDAWTIRFGGGAGRSAAYYFSGGILAAATMNATAGTNQVLNLNGGTLRAKTNNDNFIHSSIKVEVGPDHMFFDTQSYNVGFHGQLVLAPDKTTTGEIVKTGSGTLSLYGDNSAHTGGFLLREGTLAVGMNSSLGHSGAKLTIDGGTVRINGTSISNFDARPFNQNDFNGGIDVAEAGHTFTLSQALAGGGNLTKLGAGTLVLQGVSTRSGATSVSAGTLRVNGSAAHSAFTVRSGATLAGSGTVGSLTIQSGGTLAPGNSPGLLTVNGDLTLDAGSFTVLEIAGLTRGATDGYDAFSISGVLNAGGTLSVSFIDGFVPSGPATFDFFNFTSFGGSFAQVNLPVVAGHTWNTSQLSFDGTVSLVASAIPEPSAFAALAGAVALAGLGARRPRRRAVGF